MFTASHNNSEIEGMLREDFQNCFDFQGGWTALMWATYKCRPEVVSLLLERGADLNAHGNYHLSSLLWASGRGYTQIVRLLISYGAKVNVGDKYGTTPLVWASRKGHAEIVEMLLRAGKYRLNTYITYVNDKVHFVM